jgi:AcrR family transcriptional regulator
MDSPPLDPKQHLDSPQSFRRDPKQARSRALIDAILEAVNRLTTDHDLQISTKRIAEVAGVSIGSLYQYFPSKDSLFSAWWHSVVRGRVSGLLHAMVASADQPLQATIAKLVDQSIAARADMGNERALLRAYRRYGADTTLQVVDEAVVNGVAQLLRERKHETRELDPTLSAFVMVFAVRWVLFAASHVPGMVQQPALRDELVHLLVAYVAKPAR